MKSPFVLVSTLPPLFNIERILTYCQNNSLILTPNNRLRSKILQAWGDYQQAQGCSIWQAPRIEVLDQWFSQQWQYLQAKGHAESAQVIISDEQQRILWERITADCDLMQIDAVAKQAASAARTLRLWDLPLETITQAYANHNLNAQLISWITRFQQHLKKYGFITKENSYHIIGDAFTQKHLTQEETIYLLGFDDIAPLLKQQLEKATQQLTLLPHAGHQASSLQRTTAPNSEDEITLAARWAKSLLQASVEKEHQPRIGIIVPNLGQVRKKIEFIFNAEFEAHSLSTQTPRYTLPFNVSAGTPLGETPLIGSTLELLQLQQKEWDIEFIIQCLLSPFWGDYNAELEHRCALVSQLQSLGIFTISGDSLRYWAQRIDERFSDGEDITFTLFHYLDRLHQLYLQPENQGKRLPSQWLPLLLEHLTILQWPGKRTPDSQEYQQTQLWYQLLEALTHLDSVTHNMSYAHMLKQLKEMAQHTPFQAKVPDSPIQILGILEGASLDFTHCWVLGLHQHAWPPSPSPNPMLPIQLQREYNMPHASSLRELHYAESLTQNYRHCADTIIFSSPNVETDSEQTLSPSQLISDIPLIEINLDSGDDCLTAWQQKLQTQSQLELINCAQGPMFTDDVLPGGSYLLSAQSNNPFDCFAKYRLGANESIAPSNGFSSIEKGNILHDSLANIWRKLETQQALIALDQEQLSLFTYDLVTASVRDIQKRKLHHLSDTLCQLEIQRQHDLIMAWLDNEKTRPPFTVVSIEQALEITINDRILNIRIDRVDQLQDGSHLIIDYKTGLASTGDWKGERPKNPQLPLYALTYPANIKGISFAQINIAEQNFKGLAATTIAQGIHSIEKNRNALPKSWDEAVEHWQQVLHTLLHEFTQGMCDIQYTDDASLAYAGNYCRINRFYEADTLAALVATTVSEEHT